MASASEASTVIELPEATNCYGQLVAPDGVAALASRIRGPWRIRVRRSGYDGSERLRLEGDGLELESDPQGGTKHFFNGAVGGDETTATVLLHHVSEALARADVPHHLEFYGDDGTTLVMTFSHQWRSAS